MNKNERILNKMKKLIGQDEYYKLLVFFAGETVYFPFGSETEKQQRNESIRRDWEDGKKVADLVQKYDLSESQIRRIIKAG